MAMGDTAWTWSSRSSVWGGRETFAGNQGIWDGVVRSWRLPGSWESGLVRVAWELRVEGTGEAVQAEALDLRRACDWVVGTCWGGQWGPSAELGSIL